MRSCLPLLLFLLLAVPAAATPMVELATHRPGGFLAETDTRVDPRPATPVRFALDLPATVRLEVVDADGKLVRLLASGLWAAGEHTLAWHRDHEDGRAAEPGRYQLRLRTGGASMADPDDYFAAAR